MQEYLTVDEVAESLRVSRVTVYNLIHRGELATFTIGRSRRIPAASLSAYVDSRLAGDAA